MTNKSQSTTGLTSAAMVIDPCIARVDAELTALNKTNLIIPKKTEIVFLIVEIIKYILYMLVTFIIIYFVSNQLQSEEILLEFVNSKVNSSSSIEVGITVLAFFIIAASLNLLKDKMNLSPVVDEIVDDVLKEIPRTLYFFGAIFSMSCFVVYLFFFKKHLPSVDGIDINFFLRMTWVLGLSFFFVGCSLNRLLSSKSIV